MPRKAREKDSKAIYHIMCRSSSDVLLFRNDDDKNRYLDILKKYTEMYKCSIYAYCLMDTHLHLHLDPKGYDISKFMHSVNSSYVKYYNKIYKRRGHLLQERFESRILDTDEYNLAVSAYIHNNPHDIDGFSGKEEKYIFSSYGIYLGIIKDTRKLVDKSFIKELFGTFDETKFSEKYFSFVSHQRDLGGYNNLKKTLSSAIENEYKSGRNIVLRDLLPSKVLSYISSKLMVAEKSSISVKGNRKLIDYRSFCVYVLRTLCGKSFKDICNNIYNITISNCSRLCSKGYELLKRENKVYVDLFDDLICYKI